MGMPPGARKLALTAHVVSSVGWLGAVAGFLALAIVGLAGSAPEQVRAAYIAMETLGWYVIVPLSFAALVTGLVQALGTTWGVFRHYWVLFKLLITVIASVLLLVHMQPTVALADAAERGVLDAEIAWLRVQLVADAAAAVLVLLVAVALSVFKPKGTTRYGRRRTRDELRPAAQN